MYVGNVRRWVGRGLQTQGHTLTGNRMVALLMGCALLGACIALAACGGDGEPGTETIVEVDVPQSIDWAEVPGADSYRVQAWSGWTLLFEETASANQLQIDPSMHRAMKSFPRWRVVVRALAADGVIQKEEFWLGPDAANGPEQSGL